MDDVTCPDCGGERLEKYGKTAAGLQKYRCLVATCRRQFVAGSDHLIDPDVKKRVMSLLAAGVAPATIAAAEAEKSISLRWICELKRRMKTT